MPVKVGFTGPGRGAFARPESASVELDTPGSEPCARWTRPVGFLQKSSESSCMNTTKLHNVRAEASKRLTEA